MKIKMSITIDIKDNLWFNKNDSEDVEWFYRDVLDINKLLLCSIELEDYLGEIIKIEDIKEIENEFKHNNSKDSK